VHGTGVVPGARIGHCCLHTRRPTWGNVSADGRLLWLSGHLVAKDPGWRRTLRLATTRSVLARPHRHPALTGPVSRGVLSAVQT
jgi:hypothetical protein